MKTINKAKRIKINDMILEEYIADNTIIPLEFIQLISSGMKNDIISRLEYNDNNVIFEYKKVNNIKVIKVSDICSIADGSTLLINDRGTIFLSNSKITLDPFYIISNTNYIPEIFHINEKNMLSIVRQLEFYRKIGVLNGLD